MPAPAQSYAVVWREGDGRRYTGRLDVHVRSLHLEGRSSTDRWRSRWVRFGAVSSVRIGRAESERIAGRRTLVVELADGVQLEISDLGSENVLYELADLLAAPDCESPTV